MNVAKRSASKKIRRRSAEERCWALALSAALPSPFIEWLSPEDEEAFRDL
jgi:hypothetical protein